VYHLIAWLNSADHQVFTVYFTSRFSQDLSVLIMFYWVLSVNTWYCLWRTTTMKFPWYIHHLYIIHYTPKHSLHYRKV